MWVQPVKRRVRQAVQPGKRRARRGLRRHRRSRVYSGLYPYYYYGEYPYYHSYYDDPYYDPYYSAPSYDPAPHTYHRLTCRDVRNLLLQRGYRRIKAYDCKGKIYNFYAYLGHKQYKLRVRSKNGTIKSRKRI